MIDGPVVSCKASLLSSSGHIDSLFGRESETTEWDSDVVEQWSSSRRLDYDRELLRVEIADHEQRLERSLPGRGNGVALGRFSLN